MGTINYWNVRFIARHYFTLLRRNRLFLVYFLFALVITLIFQITEQTVLFKTTIRQSPGAIPYVNAYLFTAFQALAAIVFGNEAFCRSRRMDSLEAIYYRPASNAEHITGAMLGFTGAFGAVYLVFWLAALTLHLFLSDAKIAWELYLLYPATIVLPSVIFSLGLTFWVSRAIKSRMLGLLTLMGIMGLLVSYGARTWQGALDPLGLSLPAGYSDFTGLAHAGDFWLQRGCWFLLGIGCCTGSVISFHRLPNQVNNRPRIAATAGFLVAGLLFGGVYTGRYLGRLHHRETYKEVYARYAAVPKASMVAQEIDFSQQGRQMEVTTTMTLTNKTNEPLPAVMLYLNPGLEVTALQAGNQPLNFTQEKQVIQVEKTLNPGDTVTWEMTYAGSIDEAICHVNLPDRTWKSPTEKRELCLQQGKRFAYVERAYTLLTPGVLWYPTAVPPENPVARYDLPVDFTRYALRVRNPQGLTVISQGRRSGTLENILFQPEHPLTGITLCMGRYSTRRITVDGVTYEINLQEGHDYLLQPYYSNRIFRATAAIRKTRKRVEQEVGRSYPFTQLMLTETPVHFVSYYQPERGASQLVQPELILEREWEQDWIPNPRSMLEYSISHDTYLRKNNIENGFSWLNHLRRPSFLNIGRLTKKSRPHNINPLLARALFFEHVSSVHSSRFPFFNAFVQDILLDNNLTSESGREELSQIVSWEERLPITHYLKERSFKDAFQDPQLSHGLLTSILLLESREFLDRLDIAGVEVDSTFAFLNAYLGRHPFREVTFEELNKAFAAHFGVDMTPILQAQYERKGLPTYRMESLGTEIVREGNRRFSRFRIFNDSDVDGIVHILKYLPIEYDGGFEWFRRINNFHYDAYALKAGTGIEVRTWEVRQNVLETNLSLNIPSDCHSYINGYTTDTSQYIRPLSREDFLPPANEIIVDNEDEGCRMHQPSYSWLERRRARNEEPWEKYYTIYTPFPAPHWRLLIDRHALGLPIQSCLFKPAGNGETFVEWCTQLPRTGEYEIWVHAVSYASTLIPNPIQSYSIRQGTWEESIDINCRPSGKWLLLGTYPLEAGECTVTLSDCGEKGQIIYADAVKWIELTDN